MILTALLVGAGIIAGGTLLAAFWNDVVDWLKRAVEKVKTITGMIVYGTKVFIQKAYKAIQQISRHYSKDSYGRWHETTVTREVPEHEVPEEIRNMAKKSQETDITHELELQLQ